MCTSCRAAAAVFHFERYCEMIFQKWHFVYFHKRPSLNVAYTSSSITPPSCSDHSGVCLYVRMWALGAKQQPVLFGGHTFFSLCVVSENRENPSALLDFTDFYAHASTVQSTPYLTVISTSCSLPFSKLDCRFALLNCLAPDNVPLVISGHSQYKVYIYCGEYLPV